MFRIECFVDDKHLATALRALMGIAMGQPSVMPVTNAQLGPHGQVQQKGSDSMTDLVLAEMPPLGVHFPAATVVAALQKLGRAPTSKNYHLHKLIARGDIKKVAGTKGTGTRYFVVQRHKKARVPEPALAALAKVQS